MKLKKTIQGRVREEIARMHPMSEFCENCTHYYGRIRVNQEYLLSSSYYLQWNPNKILCW